MKTGTLAALLIVALALPAAAQDPTGPEEYCFTGGTLNQARRVNLGRRVHNERTCNAAGLPLDCTQAQARAVPGHETANIYANSPAGRRLYLLAEVLVPWFVTILNSSTNWEQIRARINWCAGDQAFRDNGCTALGNQAGCQLYSCE